MRFYLSIYLLIAGFYLLTASGRIGRMSDSTTMFHVAESMINEGSLSSEPCDPRYDNADIGSLCVPGRGPISLRIWQLADVTVRDWCWVTDFTQYLRDLHTRSPRGLRVY